MTAPAFRLSKSRFVAGYQCEKLLWWTVHEPDARELQPDKVLADLFDQGRLVGARARAEWPDGVLIEGDHRDRTRVPRTRAAIDAGVTVLFEACFEADGVFCAVDVLEKKQTGWTLIEVKSSTSAKDYHNPDLAVQTHVARRCGIDVTRAEVMHLNSDHRHPDTEPLFARTDVTAEVEAILPEVPEQIERQLEVLAGPLPAREIGAQCWERNGCPFFARCWPDDPDHIRNLSQVGPKKTMQWLARGVHTMSAIPPAEKLNFKQKRQLRAQRERRLIVEPTLAEAMRPAIDAPHLGFLDFESVSRALPPWPGLRPWHPTAAQFSYHERIPSGEVVHAEFLAEGPPHPSLPPDDPREAIARAMLAATERATLVVVYSPYESTRIKELAAHLPHLAEPLLALRERLWDLKPVVENHVYHPDFRGSFSLKDILTPLVPDLGYDDLVIVDGRVASVEIARLLFVSGRVPPDERERVRSDLLAYCKRDTFATVRLVERLAELASNAGA